MSTLRDATSSGCVLAGVRSRPASTQTSRRAFLRIYGFCDGSRFACWSQWQTPVIETSAPDLDVILQSIEHAQQQNRAHLRPYQVIWRYQVFRSDDKQPTSEVTAEINFTPPDMKTFKITKSSGNSRGEKIVRAILDQEADAAKDNDDN